MSLPKTPLKLFLVAGEKSGDDLGGKLISALRSARSDLSIAGVGGEAMQGQGLHSLFALSDIAVMGLGPVLARLPTIVRRVYQTVAAVGAAQPDMLVIIDSPDFTHAVAKRVRKRWPKIKIVDYVSPTVWAWRTGRARKMRAYVDHLLALLPFEPAAHERLGGPACTYVGHPLIERLGELRPNAVEAARRLADPPIILVLPGSRRSDIATFMDDFGAVVASLAAQIPDAKFILPAVAHVEAAIREKMASWPVRAELVFGEAAKYAAFRQARAALAKSGTATLELALAQVPTVVAYKVGALEAPLRHLVKVPSIVLPNLILGDNAIPEYFQERCTPPLLSAAMLDMIADTPARAAQLAALDRLDARMQLESGTPAAKAAGIILKMAQK